MKLVRISLVALVTVALLSAYSCEGEKGDSTTLVSWNDTQVRSEIISFVNAVSDKSSISFVKAENRIAVFDNDGTLWCEKPLYIPVELEMAHIKKHYADNPEWLSDDLYSGIANGDLSVLKKYDNFTLIHKLFAAHSGQPEEEYKRECYDFLSLNNHSRFNRPFKELTYLPMVELVHYLQKNDFKVFIVTGGEITSVRTISEEIYNIPKENVIGSSVKYKYVSNDEGTYIIRQAEIASANDKQIKPTNIELHIGQKPIFAAGNSDGDYEMMEYTLSGDGPSMAILVHHDDEEREYSYMHGTEKAIKHADSIGWHVISMKEDFKIIFE